MVWYKCLSYESMHQKCFFLMQENLSVALKMQVLLERNYPGICRRMQLRTERFNQDLSRAGMLVEVGAAGDTLEEALVAARAFAQCLVELSQGTAD